MAWLKSKMVVWALGFCLLLWCQIASAKVCPPDLTPLKACRKAEEILSAHVLHKMVTLELGKRILSNFLEELDPTKTYLLEEEVAPWVSPSNALISQLISDYKHQRFTLFETIYRCMLSAIKRRDRIERSLSLLPWNLNVPMWRQPHLNVKRLTWAANEERLERRIQYFRAVQVDTLRALQVKVDDNYLRRLNKYRIAREEELLQDELETQQFQQMLALFLKAFAGSLDDHSSYLTPSDARQFMIQLHQRLSGIGAQLRDNFNGFTLISLIEGGPALRQGKLRVNDRIVAVNHCPVVGMDILSAVEKIRGPKGSKVILTILRESGQGEDVLPKQFDIEIVRDDILLTEQCFRADTFPCGDGVIAHIRLFSFYQDRHHSSVGDIRNALEGIQMQHPLYGVILDLRENGGGQLPQAIEVAGLFIKKGVVASIKDSQGRLHHLRNFHSTPLWDGPLIVLINKGSASASEIVAQSLQDYGRAILVGSETWGKGSYQSLSLQSDREEHISPEGEYKVTRGLYYTVSGRSPQLVGVKADIPVVDLLSLANIGEIHGKYPLPNSSIDAHFVDRLLDIPFIHRARMARLYKQGRQFCQDIYTKHLSVLFANSQARLQSNVHYQQFLQQNGERENGPREPFISSDRRDWSLEEGVHVMKDFIFLCQKDRENQRRAS